MHGQLDVIELLGIGEGQLEGHTLAGCFVLGYELARISADAEHRLEAMYNVLVHATNQSRIEDALRLRGRRFSWRWPSDDRTEQWVYLDIEAKGG